VLLISKSGLIDALAILSVVSVDLKFDCSIKVDSILSDLEHNTFITLPDFCSYITEGSTKSSLLFFTFAFNLGAVDEPDQIKLGIDVIVSSVDENEADPTSSIIEHKLEAIVLLVLSSALIGLLKV